MTPEELAESKEYGRRGLQCALLDIAIDLVYLAVIAFGVAVALDRYLQEWPWMANRWIRLVVFYLVITAMHYLLSFPLSFYSGFVLEHRYKLSRQSFGRWLFRYVLENVLSVALSVAIFAGLFAIIWWAGPWWWPIAAFAAFVVIAVMGQLFPVLILPMFYKIEPLHDEDLSARLYHLVEGTTLSLQGVYRMRMSSETVKANAQLAGLGRTRRVILGDTLLEGFTHDEIEVVVAHEMGHHLFHHISKFMVLMVVFFTAGFFLCDQVLHRWVESQSGSFSYADVPVYALALVQFVITVVFLILSPLQNGLSRRFETDCDRFALQKTGKPQAYRSMFNKLAKLNKSDPDPHPWEVWLMHDHPPVVARLALADETAH